MQNKATLAKEERRAIFEEEVSEMFLETIKKAKPEYLLDQFIGKAPDKLQVEAQVISLTLSPEAIELAEQTLRDKKLGQPNE